MSEITEAAEAQWAEAIADSEIELEEVVDGELVEETSLAVVPYTGEALALPNLTNEQLAQVLDEAREFEYARLRGFKREVQAEVLARMDGAAEWTIHTDRYDLSGDSPNRTEFDGTELKQVLDQLVDAELLTREQADKAIVATVTLPGVPEAAVLERAKKVEYAASKAGLNSLRRLGGAVKDAIDSCERPTEKPRAVRVSVKPTAVR